MRILFLGDIVGKPGRLTVKKLLPELKKDFQIDMTIANGENAAGGFGITPAVMQELFGLGIDVLTSGNHIWNKREIVQVIGGESRLLRPANLPASSPGKGVGIFKVGTFLVAVLNIMGRVFMPPINCPFETAKKEIAVLEKITPNIIVDFHAEATSEKQALGWFLKDKVSAVLGTHTHVQTADEKIYSQKAAYISDVGMVGADDSVLGLDPDVALIKFIDNMPFNLKLAEGECLLNGVYVDLIPATGKAVGIKRLSYNKLKI